MRHLQRLILCASLLLIGACGSDDASDDGAAKCVTNATNVCACPGGGEGVQTCQADGTFSACECGADVNWSDALTDPDTGAADAGSPDTGTPDTGTSDAGTPDTGTPDTGTPDTGTPDAGTPDTGTPDAGTPDTGTPDTGTPDAGTPDSGPPDAGGTDTVADGVNPPDTMVTDASDVMPDTGGPDTGDADSGGADAAPDVPDSVNPPGDATGQSDGGGSDAADSDAGASDTGTPPDPCSCTNVECGFIPGCSKSCGACQADKQCVNNKCEAKSQPTVKKFGEYCGPTATCKAPPSGTPSSSPAQQAYQACLNAQCETKLCYLSVCTKTCKIATDSKDNVTGAAGADGIEDVGAVSQCGGAASGVLAIHGSKYACVEQASKTQAQLGQSNAVCLPAGSWKSCQSDAECGAKEACRLYFIYDELVSRCGPLSTNPDGATGLAVSKACGSSVANGGICETDICFSTGCSAMCKTDADCVSDVGACKAGKCPNGDACTGDVDCSALTCTGMQLSTSSAKKYNVCWPKGGCKTSGDCPDAGQACRLTYNGVTKVSGDPDPKDPKKVILPAFDNICVSKIAGGAKTGATCDPYSSDIDASLQVCENPFLCSNGYCSTLCETDKDCPADSKCNFYEITYDLSTPKDNVNDISLAYGACKSSKGAGKACVGSKECGAGKHCSVFVEPAPANAGYAYVAGGLCLDKTTGMGDYGALCGAASTGKGLSKVCNSSYCLNTVSSTGQAQPGFCVDLCASKTDCNQNVSIYNQSYKSVCTSLMLSWNTTSNVADDHYVPVCVPTNTKSALTDCSQTKLCAQAEQACIGYPVSMSVDKPSKVEYWCGYIGNAATATNPNPPAPNKKVGDECNLEASVNECATGYCMPDTANGKGYCSRVCNSNTDCGSKDGMICNVEYQRIIRPEKKNAAVMPLCMKAKSCVVCSSDNGCAGNYACTNIGGPGTQAQQVCSPTCKSDADCVGKDGGAKCVDLVGEDGKAVAGTKVCAASCAAPANPNSCKGKCGNPYDGNAPCQCDATCAQFGDCCNDYSKECSGP